MVLSSTSPAFFRLHGELAGHCTSGTQQLDTRHCGLRLGAYAGRKLTMSGACGRMQGLYPTSDDSSGCLELPPNRLYILGPFCTTVLILNLMLCRAMQPAAIHKDTQIAHICIETRLPIGPAIEALMTVAPCNRMCFDMRISPSRRKQDRPPQIHRIDTAAAV
jgi:hypothetical protein